MIAYMNEIFQYLYRHLEYIYTLRIQRVQKN